MNNDVNKPAVLKQLHKNILTAIMAAFEEYCASEMIVEGSDYQVDMLNPFVAGYLACFHAEHTYPAIVD